MCIGTHVLAQAAWGRASQLVTAPRCVCVSVTHADTMQDPLRQRGHALTLSLQSRCQIAMCIDTRVLAQAAWGSDAGTGTSPHSCCCVNGHRGHVAHAARGARVAPDRAACANAHITHVCKPQKRWRRGWGTVWAWPRRRPWATGGKAIVPRIGRPHSARRRLRHSARSGPHLHGAAYIVQFCSRAAGLRGRRVCGHRGHARGSAAMRCPNGHVTVTAAAAVGGVRAHACALVTMRAEP